MHIFHHNAGISHVIIICPNLKCIFCKLFVHWIPLKNARVLLLIKEKSHSYFFLNTNVQADIYVVHSVLIVIVYLFLKVVDSKIFTF